MATCCVAYRSHRDRQANEKVLAEIRQHRHAPVLSAPPLTTRARTGKPLTDSVYQQGGGSKWVANPLYQAPYDEYDSPSADLGTGGANHDPAYDDYITLGSQ